MSTGMDSGFVRYRGAVAGLAVGAACMLLASRHVDLRAVISIVATARPGPLLLALAATAGFMMIKTWRWRILLGPDVAADPKMLHWVVYVGSAANLVLAHSGEVLRAVIVRRRTGSTGTAVLGSIAVERIFDMATVVFVTCVMLAAGLEFTESLFAAVLVAAGLVVAGLTAAWLVMKRSRLRKLAGRASSVVLPPALHGWLLRALAHSRPGFAALSSGPTLVHAMALSALQWGCIVAAIWLSLSAIDHTVPLPAALAVWVLMVIGLTLPSAPAQLGTIQLAYVAGLTLAELDAATAFAASAIYTCTVNLPIMLVGWSCWGLVHRSDLVVRVRAEESS